MSLRLHFPSSSLNPFPLQHDHMSRRLHSALTSGLQSTYICKSCRANLFPAEFLKRNEQKRWITRNHIRKIQEAAEDWSLRADAIVAGKKQSMLSLLEERGYVNQIIGYVCLPLHCNGEANEDSGRDELDHLLTHKRVGVYCGVDPTAPSLHVGHMVPFMVLGWMYIHGYHSTFLVRPVLLLLDLRLTRTLAWWRYGVRWRPDRSTEIARACTCCHSKGKHDGHARTT